MADWWRTLLWAILADLECGERVQGEFVSFERRVKQFRAQPGLNPLFGLGLPDHFLTSVLQFQAGPEPPWWKSSTGSFQTQSILSFDSPNDETIHDLFWERLRDYQAEPLRWPRAKRMTNFSKQKYDLGILPRIWGIIFHHETYHNIPIQSWFKKWHLRIYPYFFRGRFKLKCNLENDIKEFIHICSEGDSNSKIGSSLLVNYL